MAHDLCDDFGWNFEDAYPATIPTKLKAKQLEELLNRPVKLSVATAAATAGPKSKKQKDKAAAEQAVGVAKESKDSDVLLSNASSQDGLEPAPSSNASPGQRKVEGEGKGRKSKNKLSSPGDSLVAAPKHAQMGGTRDADSTEVGGGERMKKSEEAPAQVDGASHEAAAAAGTSGGQPLVSAEGGGGKKGGENKIKQLASCGPAQAANPPAVEEQQATGSTQGAAERRQGGAGSTHGGAGSTQGGSTKRSKNKFKAGPCKATEPSADDCGGSGCAQDGSKNNGGAVDGGPGHAVESRQDKTSHAAEPSQAKPSHAAEPAAINNPPQAGSAEGGSTKKSKNKFKAAESGPSQVHVETNAPFQEPQEQAIKKAGKNKLATVEDLAPSQVKKRAKVVQPQQQQQTQQNKQTHLNQQQQQEQKTVVAAAAAKRSATAEDDGGASRISQPAAAPSALMERMKARLQGGQFRFLNEALYTRSGDDALSMMQEEPTLFEKYHEGFKQQTLSWPKQPVDVAIAWLAQKPADMVVADFGCGDARLEASVKQKVHSFDLVASAPGVVACNMSSVPLEDASVDAAVFSLALMGTDYGSFLVEAARVLRHKGWLWIAEVRSRFVADSKDSKQEDEFGPFLKCVYKLGFQLVKKEASNKMFAILVLRKQMVKASGPIPWPELKACVYKKR